MKVDYKHFEIQTRRDSSNGNIAVLMYGGKELFTLGSEQQQQQTELDALIEGIETFKKMFVESLFDSNDKFCCNNGVAKKAIQLSDGCWVIDRTVYTHEEFQNTFRRLETS